MEAWKPMDDDYNNSDFNRYSQGVGRDLLSTGQKNRGVRLYVKNIPVQLGQEGLYNLFAEFGAVNDHHLIAPKDESSETFGFITMEKSVDAQLAISKLHNKKIAGHQALVVRPALTNEEKDKRKRNAEMEREFLQPRRDTMFNNTPRENWGADVDRGRGFSGPALGRGQAVGASSGRGILGSHPADRARPGGHDLYNVPMGRGHIVQRVRMEHPKSNNTTKRVKPCVFCHREDSPFRCGNCKMYYCSVQCQQNDWIRHKEECATIVSLVNGGPVNRHAASRDEPFANGNEPSMRNNKPLMRSNEPSMRSNEPAMRNNGRGDDMRESRNFRGQAGTSGKGTDSDQASEKGGRSGGPRGGDRRGDRRRDEKPATGLHGGQAKGYDGKGPAASGGSKCPSLPQTVAKKETKSVPDESGDGAVDQTPPLPGMTVPEGASGQGILTYYESPSKFWISLQDTFDSLCELIQEMTSLDQEPDVPLSELKAGELIGVKYNEEWARGYMLSKTGQSAEVLYVDFGNQETVNLKGVKRLQKPLVKTTPAQALCCCLSQVRPKWSPEWSGEAVEAGMQWLGTPMEAIFSYTVKARRGSIMALDIKKEVNGESMADFLVGGNHAEKVDSEQLLPCLPKFGKSQTSLTPASRVMAREVKSMVPGLSVGQHFRCAVLENPAPRSFIVRMVTDATTEHLRNLDRMLNLVDDCDQHEHVPDTGELVVAQHPGRGSWQRAEVLAVDGQVVSLHFLDLGHTDVQMLEKIRPVMAGLEGLKACPALALKCALSGAEVPASVEDILAQQKFASLLQEYKEDGLLMAVMKSKSETELLLDFKSISKPLPLSGALRKELLSLAKGYLSDSSRTSTPPKQAAPQRSPVSTASGIVRNLSMALKQGTSQAATTLDTAELPKTGDQLITVRVIKDCSEFFVTLDATQKDFELMDMKLNSLSQSLSPLSQPTVGAVAAAHFYVDKKLYRCRVESIRGRNIEVRYVDFGNSEIVSMTELFNLPHSLTSLPAQAIRCRLKGEVENLSPEVHEDFKTAENRPLLARKVEEVNGTCVVQLFLRDEGTDVGELLGITKKSLTATPSQVVPAVKASPILEVHSVKTSPQLASPPRQATRCLPPASVKQGQQIKVECLNALSPAEFYVQERDNVQEYMKATLALNARLEAGTSPIGQVAVGNVVASRCSEDPEMFWYRARVQEVRGSGQCLLFFLDYGNFEEANVADLQALSAEDFALPPSTLKCRLAGCETDCDQDLNKKFIESAQTQIDSIKIQKKIGDDLVVDIYDHTGNIITKTFLKEPAVADSVSLPKPTAMPVQRLETEFLPSGQDLIPVTVTFIESPSELFVNLCAGHKQQHLIEMMVDLNKSAPSLIQLDNPCVGALCAAQFSQDNTWYRAIVENMLDPQTCLVQFVDYGNSETTSVAQLKKLDAAFCVLPAQAIPCCLQGHEAGLGRGGVKTMTDVELVHLKQQLMECRVNVCVQDRRAGTCVVTMETEHGEPITAAAPTQAPESSTVDTPGAAVVALRDDLIDEIPPQKTFPAVIHHNISATEFFCTRKQEFDGILQLSEQLERDVVEVGQSPETIVLNGVYCCNFSGVWYRCAVEKISGSTVSICYIDFGNSEERPVEDLRMLNPDRLSIPVCAIRCKLHGLSLKADADAQTVAQYWSLMQYQDGVTITIEGEEAECMLVSATMERGGRKLDVATDLLEIEVVDKAAEFSEQVEEEEENSIEKELERLKRQLEELKMKKKTKSA